MTGSSHDNLATLIHPLDDILTQAAKYKPRQFSSVGYVTLDRSLDNESNSSVALVRFGNTQPLTDLNRPPVSPGNFINAYQVGVTRAPFWEAASATTDTFGSINCCGGTSTRGSVVNGQVPSRIVETIITTVDPTLTQVWLGWRSTDYGTLANFVPNWDFGDSTGTFINNTARATSVTGAINTQVARWTPAGTAEDDAMLPRAVIEMSDLTSNYDDQHGTFKALLRCRMTAVNDEFRVKLSHGLFDGSTSTSGWATSKRVLIPGDAAANSFYYYDMGTVSLPPRTHAGEMGHFSFMVEAERTATAGGGNLEFDAVTMIPVNEGAIHFKGATISPVVPDQARIAVDIDDSISVSSGDLTGGTYFAQNNLEFTPYKNWTIPNASDVMLVAVAQQSDESDITDVVSVSVEILTRFLTLHGSVT